jgi:hypothetical protein
MNQGKTVFAQLLQFVPFSHFEHPGRLRRVSFRDLETGKHLVFLTNLHTVPALTIAAIYENRRHIELFFKWLKKNPGRQAFLWQLDQFRKSTNLGGRLCLSAGADRYPASSITRFATDFFASHRNQYFRKNHAGSTSCKCRTERRESAHR